MLAVQKGWDDSIRNLMPNSLAYSLWFYDGWQDKINTLEILGRKRYESQGYIYNPEFKSFFCDNLSTDKAQKDGKMIKSKDCIIKHFHPCCTKDTHMKLDEIYSKCNKDWNEDEATYNRLK
jgi:hypothetical protein